LTGTTPREAEAIAAIDAPAMRDRVERWAAIGSGSSDLPGLARMGEALADVFGALPGTLRWHDPAPVQRVGADGVARAVAHGRHLGVRVRPDAPVQLLLTGHMDTVYGADHPFKAVREIEPGVLNGPGVADMKGADRGRGGRRDAARLSGRHQRRRGDRLAVVRRAAGTGGAGQGGGADL
jgi:glutamate carboxypeptidase